MIAYTFRLLAALLAGFVLINVLAGLVAHGLDASIWVLDLRWLPSWASVPVIAACGAVIGGAFWPDRWPRVQAAALCVLGLLALIDAARFYALLAGGTIHTELPVPASVCYAAVFTFGALAARRPRLQVAPHRRLAANGLAIAAASLFPVLQMACFGLTDYRRPADAALVFGARTYSNGQLSDALSDRITEACALYHQGLAHTLILSGGPGDGAIDEAEAMRRRALELGVPDSALILDHAGVNTRASVRNAAAICRERGLTRVLAVSHFYHLPRIKLEAARAGLKTYTVPAPQGQPLKALPWFVARETAAWWAYWARPLAHTHTV